MITKLSMRNECRAWNDFSGFSHNWLIRLMIADWQERGPDLQLKNNIHIFLPNDKILFENCIEEAR